MKQNYLSWKLIMMLLVITASVHAQQIVRGSVSNQSDGGSALPGVIVLEKGTSNNTLTSLSGEYTITVKGPESVLYLAMLVWKLKKLKPTSK